MNEERASKLLEHMFDDGDESRPAGVKTMRGTIGANEALDYYNGPPTTDQPKTAVKLAVTVFVGLAIVVNCWPIIGQIFSAL